MSVSLARRSTARVLLVGLLASSAVALGAPSPASAQTAGDPAPSADGRVTVVSTTSYNDSSLLQVIGEVRNDWDRVAGFPKVGIELLDASGNVLESSEAFGVRSALAPGERTGFRRSFTRPAAYASYRVSRVDTNPSFRVPNHGFEVTITGQTAEQISGTVKNTNTSTVDAPQVELHLRDGAGALYDVDTAFPKGTGNDGDMAAGETASFTVPRFRSEPFRAGGSVVGLAESTTAPSPYPTEVVLRTPAKVVAGESGRVEIDVLGKGATGPAPAGITVELHGREAKQSAFRLLRTATTTGSGPIRFDLKPQRDIRWQARVPAATNALSSASGSTLTQVAFGVTTTGTTNRDSATLRGRVLPASAGQVVHLQQQTGGAFRNVASYRLTSASTYVFTLRKGKGRYVYRVVKPAVTGNQAGTGPTMILTVF